MRDVPVSEQWQLARATVDWLAGWQPQDEDEGHLEAVEMVALGRAGSPGVEMRWRQGYGAWAAHFGLTISIEDLMSSADYDEWMHPPDDPSPDHWLGVLCLAVYEPHERAGLPAARWWFDYLP